MNYPSLQSELSADPLGRGYSGMSDAEAAASLNAVDRTRQRAMMTGSEVLNAIDETEFDGLSAENKQLVWDLLHLGELNPFGVEAALFVNIFGGASATITKLQTDRLESISRAEELGLGLVTDHQVNRARAM